MAAESLAGKTERRKARNASIFETSLVRAALGQSFRMLNPVIMAKNPVMFITEVGRNADDGDYGVRRH